MVLNAKTLQHILDSIDKPASQPEHFATQLLLDSLPNDTADGKAKWTVHRLQLPSKVALDVLDDVVEVEHGQRLTPEARLRYEKVICAWLASAVGDAVHRLASEIEQDDLVKEE